MDVSGCMYVRVCGKIGVGEMRKEKEWWIIDINNWKGTLKTHLNILEVSYNAFHDLKGKLMHVALWQEM